ncbi:unnamed protein product [Arctia plantaginis]|uniref:Major facilitator superfamily (MFS) profile domain-containing protein n=1 Tax=Arctia plantaginis TaxID=874455 RepID=A0A8S1BDT9_ARCPL|nr:unnamed protein product [Arctia plantaginis]
MAVDKVVYDSVPTNERNLESLVHTSPKGWGVRHVQILLIFFCLVMGLSMRSQLSVLMVAMINTTDHEHYSIANRSIPSNSTSIIGDNSEGYSKVQNISPWSVYRTYEWNKSTQEIIMYSFFVGYTSMQMPMGWFAQKFGGKIPIMVALGVNGVLCICTPWIVLMGGWISTSVCRLLQGMTQAAFYPSMHTMLAKWTPLRERARLTTYAYSGSPIGTIIAFQISGFLADNPAFGWPVSFWLFGSLSLIVCGLIGYFGAALPHEHPNISAEELVYIMEDCDADMVPKRRKTPWREMLKCPSIWGILITQSGSSAASLLIMAEIPLYMRNVLGVELKKNGIYSSLPYMAMSVMSLIFGNLADFVSNRNILKVVNIRRVGNTIGMAVSGLFLLAFSFTKNTLLAVCLLILAMAMHSGINVGFTVNQIDLAPNFAGSIMALGNMMGNLTGLLVPVVVSNIVADVKNPRQWQIVFIIFTAIQFISNTIFVIFAKAEVQPWNFYGDEERDSEEKVLSLMEYTKDIKTDKNKQEQKF